MARVLPIEVNRIYSVANANDHLPFIETANLIVTEELADQGLSAARLKQVELYLAAHYAVITLERGGLKSQKINEAEEDYKVIADKNQGIASTRFGQQAIALDTSGKLGELTSSILKAEFRVVTKV